MPTQDIEAGQLLLVSEPVACLNAGAAGGPPDHEDLYCHMMSKDYTPEQLLLLSLAYDGSAAGEGDAEQLPDLRQLHIRLRRLAGDAHSSGVAAGRASCTIDGEWSASGSGSDRQDSAGGHQADAAVDAAERNTATCAAASVLETNFRLSSKSAKQTLRGRQRLADKLMDITTLNCFAEEAEDPVSGVVWGRKGNGHIGLWVEHAWMNHSCSPNVVNYVIGDRMVVRAAKRIAAGVELCDQYLGGLMMAPVQVCTSFFLVYLSLELHGSIALNIASTVRGGHCGRTVDWLHKVRLLLHSIYPLPHQVCW